MAKYTTTKTVTITCPACNSDKVVKAGRNRGLSAIRVQGVSQVVPRDRQDVGTSFSPRADQRGDTAVLPWHEL